MISATYAEVLFAKYTEINKWKLLFLILTHLQVRKCFTH